VGWRCQNYEKKKVFFFEKKNQKTFICLAPRKVKKIASGDEGVRAKVFCFFFSKKKSSFS
jgi:hypothetical protein